MTSQAAEREDNNWGTRFIETVLYPFAQVAAPGFLLLLMVWFVGKGLTDNLGHGIRSFAAVLLPLMALTFLVKARRANDDARGSDPQSESWLMKLPAWASFAAMLVLAALTMQLLRISTSIPIVEVVLSGAFSIITFMRTSGAHYVSYCLGTVLGALGYLVFVGVPSL